MFCELLLNCSIVMSGLAPIPKPRASLKTHEDDESSAAQLGSPPAFKPPPPRPKAKPVAAVPSNEEPVSSSKDEVIHLSQVDLELDPSKDKTPTKNAVGRVAPPVPKNEQAQKSITDSPKRPAPHPPRQASNDPDSKTPASASSPSPIASLPTGPKHSRSVSTGHKLPSQHYMSDVDHKSSHSRKMSEHITDDTSPKITPKRVAPPPPASGAKGDKKPSRPDEHTKVTTRSESCQQFTTIPLAPTKQKELKPKEKKAPAIPASKQSPQAAKSPQKQSSIEKMSNPEDRTTTHEEDNGEQTTTTTITSSARDRVKKAGVALPIALIKEQAEAKKKGLQQQQEGSSRSTEPTISYMDSPMLATDDTSRKVKFSRQLKTWLTYASEEYDRANDVNVVQAAVLYELEKLIEKMHIYSVQLSKCELCCLFYF